MMNNDSIGVDISCDKPDVHRLNDGAFARTPNAETGF